MVVQYVDISKTLEGGWNSSQHTFRNSLRVPDVSIASKKNVEYCVKVKNVFLIIQKVELSCIL